MEEDNENLESELSETTDIDYDFGKCPNCEKETFDLEIIDEFTKDSLNESKVENDFDAVCIECLELLKTQITQVGRHQAETNKLREILLKKWSRKLEILKTGRSLMSQKIYSEARKYYEEYIEILEATYKTGPEGINPMLIPTEQRAQEATVLCHLYWDLIFIFDQYEAGTAKLKFACDKLRILIPHSRGKNQVIRKVKRYIPKSKNADIIKNLYSKIKNSKGGCFIATAVFDDPHSSELSTLRNFRDQVLKKFYLGRVFIFQYYKHSPTWANKLKRYNFMRRPLKGSLKIIATLIRFFS